MNAFSWTGLGANLRRPGLPLHVHVYPTVRQWWCALRGCVRQYLKHRIYYSTFGRWGRSSEGFGEPRPDQLTGIVGTPNLFKPHFADPSDYGQHGLVFTAMAAGANIRGSSNQNSPDSLYLYR